MTKPQDKLTKETIKSLYRDFQETTDMNQPEAYLMPRALFDSIIKKVGHLQDYLKEARKGRDNWRAKYEELKKTHNSSKSQENKSGETKKTL